MWSLTEGFINKTNDRFLGIPLLTMHKNVGIPIIVKNKSINPVDIIKNENTWRLPIDSTQPIRVTNDNILLNTYNLDLSNTLIDSNNTEIPEIIYINGTTLNKSPFSSTNNLVPNTFKFDPITKKITIAVKPFSKEENSLKSGLPLKVVTFKNPVLTDYINSLLLPEILKGIPLRGSLQISLGFEQNPTASLEIITDYRYIDLFKKVLVGGTELDFYNIGFRVNSISIKSEPRSHSPNMEYILSVSLGGKWENYTDKEINLNKALPRNLGTGYKTNKDDNAELCTNNNKSNYSSTLNRNKNYLPLNTLTNTIGVPICGIPAFIEVEKDTPLDTWVNWFSVLQEHLRINKSFLFLSNSNCIQGKHINAVNTFRIQDENVINYDGTSINSKLNRKFPKFIKPLEPINIGQLLPSVLVSEPAIVYRSEDTSLIPYGYEYRNTKLDGKFNNPLADTSNVDNEETQNSNFKEQKPSWRRKSPQRITTKQGDLYPTVPPPYTAGICEGYDLSLNWDSSGPTKVLRINTTENGSPLREEVYTYGFVYTASDIAGIDEYGYPAAKKPLNLLWGLVQEEITEHFYDTATGYYVGCETNGWRIGRFRQENATEPETVLYAHERLRIAKELEDGVQYSRNDDDGSIIQTPLTEAQISEWIIEAQYCQAIIEACQPRKLKTTSRTLYSLEPFHKYYQDIEMGGYETYQICLPNGKLGYGLVNDPSWVAPHFVAFEYRETNSFDKMSNPENIVRKWEYDKTRLPTEPEEYVPLPPLTVGEESHYVQQTIVYPKEKIQNWELSELGSKEAKVDRYTKYSNEYSGQDSQFNASLHTTKFEEYVGRPSEGSKKDLGWEKIEPKQPQENPPDLNNGSSSYSPKNSIEPILVGSSKCDTNTVSPDAYNELQKIKSIIISNTNSYTTSINNKIDNHKLNQDKYEYIMTTKGVDLLKDAPGGSVSYNYAYTLQQAIDAAQTDLYILNVQNTLTTTFTIPFNISIREFDKIELVINGESMLRRVLSVSHSIDIHGLVNGEPFTTGTTTITCGLDRCINFDLFKKLKPETLATNNPSYSSKKIGEDLQTITRFIILNNKPIEMGGLLNINVARRTSFDF